MNKKELLKKYYQGNTTLKEEAYLKQQNWIEDDCLAEKQMFADMNQLTNQTKHPKPLYRRYLPYAITAIAASLLLLVGVYYSNKQEQNTIKSELLVDASFSGEITDEQMALEQTKKALNFMNHKINQATKELKHIKNMNQTINQIKNQSK